jgi:hypothetical protein
VSRAAKLSTTGASLGTPKYIVGTECYRVDGACIIQPTYSYCKTSTATSRLCNVDVEYLVKGGEPGQSCGDFRALETFREDISRGEERSFDSYCAIARKFNEVYPLTEKYTLDWDYKYIVGTETVETKDCFDENGERKRTSDYDEIEGNCNTYRRELPIYNYCDVKVKPRSSYCVDGKVNLSAVADYGIVGQDCKSFELLLLHVEHYVTLDDLASSAFCLDEGSS